jgi:putative hemolysin
VMTARPNIFAVPSTTTIEEFTNLLRDKPHSRIPVYSTNIDHIEGMVLAHDLIQLPDDQARITTVARLVRPVLFVPETKMTSQLLREMQKDNIHMAVVIDEYGGVAGLVTLEDLVEEIVGEIRDEHELSHDIVRESENAYVMQGSVDVGRLQDLFDVRLDARETATIGGLVSAIAGRILQPGEVVEEDGLRFEILESTDRKIEKVRVCRITKESGEPPANQVQA